MSVQIGYPGHTENRTLTVDMLARQLDPAPKVATKLRRDMQTKLAELANTASFTTVAKLEQIRADTQAAIAELEQQIEQAEADCAPAALKDPARVTAAAKKIRKAQDQLAEARLRFRAADSMLPQALQDRTVTKEEGSREIIASLKPRWQEAIRATESAIHERLTEPLSEWVALERFWRELSGLNQASIDKILHYANRTEPEPAPAATG